MDMTMIRKNFVLSLVLLAFVMATAVIAGCRPDKPVASTKTYPVKPITVIVSYAMGGSPDIMARAMEKVAVKYLGQPLIIVNMPGGSGTIGWNELAGAQPDGYTIGFVADGVFLQPLYGPTKYHYPTALEPLAQVAELPLVLAVRADSPWQNVNDVIKYARQHPGEIKYAHSGLGTILHVAGELFTKEADIDIAQVPFRGEPESLAALLGGHVQLMFTALPGIKEQIASGNVRVLAIATEQRLPESEYNGMPTFKEQGLNIVLSRWNGIAVPKELPEEVKSQLAAGLEKILNDPDFVTNLKNYGITVNYLGPQAVSDKWLQENAMVGEIIHKTGIAEQIAAQKK